MPSRRHHVRPPHRQPVTKSSAGIRPSTNHSDAHRVGRRSRRRGAGAIHARVMSPAVGGWRLPRRRSPDTDRDSTESSSEPAGVGLRSANITRNDPRSPNGNTTRATCPPGARARALAIISRHDGGCRAGIADAAEAGARFGGERRHRRDERSCAGREREVQPRDRPHHDREHAPDADGAMHLPPQPVAAPGDVDRERAPPGLAAGPPDHDAGDAHHQDGRGADAIDRATGAARQQVEVQILERADQRSLRQLAEHLGADRIDQHGREARPAW